MRKLLVAATLAATILSLAAGAVAAGGWASIQPDSGELRPNAGQTVDLGFTVLQHGETPAGWVHAIVVATDAASGESMRISALPSGADGHFLAAVTFPNDGFWSWHVELTELQVEATPFFVTVSTADGQAPTFDAATVFGAIGRARNEVRVQVMEELAPRVERLEGQVQARDAEVQSLRTRIAATPAADVTSGATTLPLAALIGIAVLAGATAGFAMTVLARRGDGSTPDAVREIAVPGGIPTTR
jgi:hypothetical protein